MRKRMLSVGAAVAVAVLTGFSARANSWSYSGNMSSAGGTITDGQWTINVTHAANADTVMIAASSSGATAQDLETLDLTGSITTQDGQALHLVGIESAKNASTYAFAKKTVLSVVVLPEGLETCGAHAFFQCTGLTTVTFPSTLKTIAAPSVGNTYGAFHGCSALKTIYGLESIEELDIGKYAFAECRKLVLSSFPAKMKIGEKAFSSCESLTNFVLSAGSLETASVFEWCSSLEEVVFGKGVTDIKGTNFANSPKLKTVRFLGYPSGTIVAGYDGIFGTVKSDPGYSLRVYLPDTPEWHSYCDTWGRGRADWDNAPAEAKAAYEQLYPGDPYPALYRCSNWAAGSTTAWVFFEEPISSGKVTLSIDGNVKIEGQPVGQATPAYSIGVEYEVEKMPTCTVEPIATSTGARFGAYGCEIAKRVEGVWTVVSTNETLSYTIEGAVANEEYRLTWLFNRAYEPQLAAVPTVLGEVLGTVTTNSTPNVDGRYYAVGTTVTFEASAGSAPFVRWYGTSVPTERAYDNPITITVDGPLGIKAFFRSSKFQYGGGQISDGYLVCDVSPVESGSSGLVVGTRRSNPPDMDLDFMKPIQDLNGQKYSIVRTTAKFFHTDFGGEDRADSARRVRFPATLDRDTGLVDESLGVGGNYGESYRFLDFGGDMSYDLFVKSRVTLTDVGPETLITVPRGLWQEILTNETAFTPWRELTPENRSKWDELGVSGRRPVGWTKTANIWIRYDKAPGMMIMIH